MSVWMLAMGHIANIHNVTHRQLNTPMLLCAMCQESHKQMSISLFSFFGSCSCFEHGKLHVAQEKPK